MEAMRALSVEIGPRPAGSSAERRAAEYCAARLSEVGLEVTTEEFHSRGNYATWFAAYLGLAAVAALLIVPLPLLAMLLGAAALVLYARDAEGRALVHPRSVMSRNVVARPQEDPEPRLVVMAHLDSARASLGFHPRVVAGFRTSVVILNTALVAVPLTGAGAWIAEAGASLPAGLWFLSAAITAYLAFAIALLLHGHLRMPLVAGANDNASGVEVLMRVAGTEPGPGVWFVVTGSEEVGMLGARAFLDAHLHELGNARILNIDNVGAGTLLAVEAEGALRERRADGYLIDAAVEAGAEARPFRGLPTDATVAIARRMKAMTLLTVNERGVPDNWHWTSDTIENVDPGSLDRATTVASHVVASVVGAQAGR